MNDGKLTSSGPPVMAYKAICRGSCGTTRSMGVAVGFGESGAFLAGKALVREGWVCTQNAPERIWWCPACWARRVATMGVTSEVEQALEKRKQAVGIEVVGDGGAR